jgi:hypothetical protein
VAYDVTAYNDVTIHGLTAPRPVRDFLDLMEGYGLDLLADQQLEAVALYVSYERAFAKYLRDPDALKFREDRKRRMAAQGRRRR